MEEALQYKETAQFIGLPTASPRSHRDHGNKTGHALTFKTDHSMGADQVALPMLEFSEALSDADLIEIVRTQGSQRLTAIAGRSTVSEAVSDVLVDHGDETAVAVLVGNEGAQLAETTMHKVADKFGDSEAVQTPLVMRATLPISVSERLVAKVSDKLVDHLIIHHELPNDLVLQTRERATLGLLTAGANEHDVFELVAALAQNGRLTPSILLRSICVGDLNFFEAGLAHMSGISVINARKLIHDKGSYGFDSLYTKCGLPEGLLAAFRIALEVMVETGRRSASTVIHKRMLERVLTQFEDLVDKHSPEDVDFLLNRLNRAANAA